MSGTAQPVLAAVHAAVRDAHTGAALPELPTGSGRERTGAQATNRPPCLGEPRGREGVVGLTPLAAATSGAPGLVEALPAMVSSNPRFIAEKTEARRG